MQQNIQIRYILDSFVLTLDPPGDSTFSMVASSKSNHHECFATACVVVSEQIFQIYYSCHALFNNEDTLAHSCTIYNMMMMMMMMMMDPCCHVPAQVPR